jgi:EpsI family protein
MTAARRKAMVFLAAAVGTSAAALAMVPREAVADIGQALSLETAFPSAFGPWQLDRDVIQQLPSAELQQVVAEAYDQTLSRTYVNAQGYRILLSVAYGGRRNQGMDIHRPEICYPAQGMALRSETHEAQISVAGLPLPVKRLVAGSGNRNEPISYWLVIGRSVASFGYGHRWALLKYGLTGHVPDGMLVRVSSIDTDEPRAFAAHEVFVRDMLMAATPEFRSRLLGQD